MLYLTCTMISRVDLAHYRESHATDWVSVDCGKSAVVSYVRFCLGHRQCRMGEAQHSAEFSFYIGTQLL